MNGKADPLDMTGQWHGTFSYPRNLGPATPFLATIAEAGGGLSGTIIEPDAMYRTGRTMDASLAGHRSGRSVDFTKAYGGQVFGYENPVDYVGQLAADGQSVTGVWSLLDMNGKFEMHREAQLEEAEAAERQAEVPESVSLR